MGAGTADQRIGGNTAARRLGATLAALALCLQLAFAGWFPLALPGDGAGADLPAHALCLAGGGPASDAPTPAPPLDRHQAGLCLWHCSQAIAAPPLGASLRVAQSAGFLEFAASPGTPLPATLPVTVRARSPPLERDQHLA